MRRERLRTTSTATSRRACCYLRAPPTLLAAPLLASPERHLTRPRALRQDSKRLPINLDTMDLFEKIKDGVLLWRAIPLPRPPSSLRPGSATPLTSRRRTAAQQAGELRAAGDHRRAGDQRQEGDHEPLRDLGEHPAGAALRPRRGLQGVREPARLPSPPASPLPTPALPPPPPRS